MEYAKGQELRRKASGYAHARQFLRLRRTVKRQRTILGIVLRKVRRKLTTVSSDCATGIARLNTLLKRAERIRTQQTHDKNKLYALHAPEVECISKGKARKRYEFGVKDSIVVTHKSGLVVAPGPSPAIRTMGIFSRRNWSRPTSCSKTPANHLAALHGRPWPGATM